MDLVLADLRCARVFAREGDNYNLVYAIDGIISRVRRDFPASVIYGQTRKAIFLLEDPANAAERIALDYLISASITAREEMNNVVR